MAFFDKLKLGLTKTKNSFTEKIDSVLSVFHKVDEDLMEELEEALITADVGAVTSMEIIDRLRDKVKEDRISEVAGVKDALAEIIAEMMCKPQPEEPSSKELILVIGVNGAGKTTSAAKLAYRYKKEGKSVLLAAADTFRAAAIDQLQIWADRCGVDLIKQGEGSDPAAVVFDALSAAKSRNTDVLIVDTAGRLHNKKNLMEELRKILRIATEKFPEAKKEVLLVLDAGAGQNALSQAKLFGELDEITGIILTKLDGTAKGGVIIGISAEQHIPVKYIGLGEDIDSLERFKPDQFAKALFE
ncbi:MAG: signal recognition particle-docking protein FtsY [Clostridia bacterium]|nr:signal recognition particle-docking protein FtsY [Clostridia bacterium]